MYKLFISVYGWDHTEYFQLKGEANETLAREMWKRFVRDIPFTKNAKNHHTWESRGGFSIISIEFMNPPGYDTVSGEPMTQFEKQHNQMLPPT